MDTCKKTGALVKLQAPCLQLYKQLFRFYLCLKQFSKFKLFVNFHNSYLQEQMSMATYLTAILINIFITCLESVWRVIIVLM